VNGLSHRMHATGSTDRHSRGIRRDRVWRVTTRRTVSVIGSHHGGMPPTRCRPVTRIINRLRLEVRAARVGHLLVIGGDQIAGCHATGQCHPRFV
jgi:hypothetical protein